MAPTTPLRIVDIHSNAARLLPKPMLPNAAKITRMIIRRSRKSALTFQSDHSLGPANSLR